jgi:hypothetical protein
MFFGQYIIQTALVGEEQTVLNTCTFIVIKNQFKDQYLTFVVLISLLNKDNLK